MPLIHLVRDIERERVSASVQDDEEQVGPPLRFFVPGGNWGTNADTGGLAWWEGTVPGEALAWGRVVWRLGFLTGGVSPLRSHGAHGWDPLLRH